MNASEHIEAAIHLKGGRETPVAPLIISLAARYAGMTQADIFSSLRKWQQALELTINRNQQNSARITQDYGSKNYLMGEEVIYE